MKHCDRFIESAHNHLRTAEAKETSSLRIAHTLAQKAQAQVREAQQFSAHIRTLENPSIARESVISLSHLCVCL